MKKKVFNSVENEENNNKNYENKLKSWKIIFLSPLI